MITIEEVQAWNSWANGKDTFKPHSVNKLSLADLALSQHEEIERLRAELAEVRADQAECNAGNEWQAREIERLKRERDEAYERAAQVCELEEVSTSEARHHSCHVCALAIRALKSVAPTNEHKWKCSPGVWEADYTCELCGKGHTQRHDVLSDTPPPKYGCTEAPTNETGNAGMGGE